MLAIATWFLLVQTGFQDQANGNNGQTGVFILAAVSFTVGLVTNEIVQYLIDFVKKRFGISSSTPKLCNDKRSKLLVKSQTAKNPISLGDVQYITANVYDEDLGNSVSNANIKGIIFYKTQFVEQFVGKTDLIGEFTYRIKNKLELGDYSI